MFSWSGVWKLLIQFFPHQGCGGRMWKWARGFLFPGRAVGERLASQNISIINHFWHRPTISVRLEKHECVSADFIVICCADKLQLPDGGFVWNWPATGNWQILTTKQMQFTELIFVKRLELYIFIAPNTRFIKKQIIISQPGTTFFLTAPANFKNYSHIQLTTLQRWHPTCRCGCTKVKTTPRLKDF